MLGYIKPKKLKLERFQDNDGDYCYKIDCSDGCPDEYRELSDHIFASEEDAHIEIENIQWRLAVEEELKELDKLRDELIATEAPLGAKINRIIKQLEEYADADEFPGDFGGMSVEVFFEMQEHDDELRRQIQALDDKEERIKSVMLPAKRNRHIDTYGRIYFDKKEKLYFIELCEETDGITKRIAGKTIDEVQEKVSIEDDRLRMQQGVIPESGGVNNAWMISEANRSITKLSAAETRYLLELYNYAIFGSAVDRKAAREKIFEMLGLNDSLDKITDLELRKEGHTLREIAEDPDADNWNSRAFAGYIDRYTDRTGRTKGYLCDTIKYDQSNLSKCISGKQKPSKMTAIKLALAMELSLSELKGFMTAAGHPFPSGGSGGLDEQVIWLFARYNNCPSKVLEELMNGSGKSEEEQTTEKKAKKAKEKDNSHEL